MAAVGANSRMCDKRPANLRKLEEAVVLEADLLCGRRRRALHPAQRNRIGSIGVGIFDAVDFDYAAFHELPLKMWMP